MGSLQNPNPVQVGHDNGIVLNRAWAMPNHQTFKIKPIADLLEVVVGPGWIDPFANENSPCEITNDIDKAMPTDFHLDAVEFVEMFEDASKPGAVFDPPYSIRQALEMYSGNRIKRSTVVKNQLARVIQPGGICICFGWNSNGLGAKRDFKLERLLIVAHGGEHNDTIVTVERKLNHQSRMFRI